MDQAQCVLHAKGANKISNNNNNVLSDTKTSFREKRLMTYTDNLFTFFCVILTLTLGRLLIYLLCGSQCTEAFVV